MAEEKPRLEHVGTFAGIPIFIDRHIAEQCVEFRDPAGNTTGIITNVGVVHIGAKTDD